MLDPQATTGVTTGSILATGPFYKSATLKLDGRVSAGDVWHLGIRNQDYTYTATSTDTLSSVATALGSQLPSLFTVTVSSNNTGTYITIENKKGGFQLAGLNYNGFAQLSSNVARVTRSTTVTQT